MLSRFVRPLDGGPRPFDPIFERIGDAHTVLIGEASHGTHEFYAARAGRALQPLLRSPIQPAAHEPAETYPFGV